MRGCPRVRALERRLWALLRASGHRPRVPRSLRVRVGRREAALRLGAPDVRRRALLDALRGDQVLRVERGCRDVRGGALLVRGLDDRARRAPAQPEWKDADDAEEEESQALAAVRDDRCPECAAHRGCAFSQAAGACVSLNVVAADKAVCVSSSECPVADTFCNMDFGSKGYCQNCLPLAERGVGVCADEATVAAPAAEECARACFGGK